VTPHQRTFDGPGKITNPADGAHFQNYAH